MAIPVSLAAIQELEPEGFDLLIRQNIGYPDPRRHDDVSVTEKRQQLWGMLSGPSLIERTEQALVRLLRALDDQIATRRAEMDSYHQQCWNLGEEGKRKYFAAKGEYDLWRTKILKDKQIISLRHSDIKRIRAASGPNKLNGRHPAEPNPDKRKRNQDTLFRLAFAVVKHRDTAEAEGILPMPHDVELHAKVDDLAFYSGSGEEISLSDWVEEISSRPEFQPRPDM